jgi:hypothetical protein
MAWVVCRDDKGRQLAVKVPHDVRLGPCCHHEADTYGVHLSQNILQYTQSRMSWARPPGSNLSVLVAVCGICPGCLLRRGGLLQPCQGGSPANCANLLRQRCRLLQKDVSCTTAGAGRAVGMCSWPCRWPTRESGSSLATQARRQHIVPIAAAAILLSVHAAAHVIVAGAACGWLADLACTD